MKFAAITFALFACLMSGCVKDKPSPAPIPEPTGGTVTERLSLAEMSPGLTDSDIEENSGMAVSTTYPNRLYTINDSGNDTILFVSEWTGANTKRISMPFGIDDWEDIDVGPCNPGDVKVCVFIADIGDNSVNRKNVTIYSFPEPSERLEKPTQVTTLKVTYNTGKTDAETFMVHPITGERYILDKNYENKPHNLYKITGTVATRVATYASVRGSVGAGDISPDGTKIIAIDSDDNRKVAWVLDFESNVLETFDALYPLGSHESIAWLSDDRFLYGSEGSTRLIQAQILPKTNDL